MNSKTKTAVVGAAVAVVGVIAFLLAATIGTTISIVHGQPVSSAPYANCISFSMEGKFVQLGTDENCDKEQFNAAVAHYKANGYPVEDTVMDIAGIKIMALKTQEWADTVKAMEAIK